MVRKHKFFSCKYYFGNITFNVRNIIKRVPTFANPTFNGTISGTVVLGVSNGGTGNSTLTGYVVGNGTASFTAVTSIPVSNVNGAVQSVNGIFPDLSGNVTVTLGTVTTGTLAARPPVGLSISKRRYICSFWRSYTIK